METKEKIENLKYISQVHRHLHDERRKIEWKILFTSLTFCILCITFVYTQKIKLEEYIKYVSIGFFFIFWLVLSYFLIQLHKANYENKIYAEDAENIIGHMLRNDELTYESPFKRNKKNIEAYKALNVCRFMFRRENWAFQWQSITILMFSCLAVLLIFIADFN